MKINSTNHSFPHDHLSTSELTILVESIRSITSSLDLDEVLKKIMQNALKVIPATDAGYLSLYDNMSERLLVSAPINFNKHIYQFKVKKGESITGKVFEDGIGRIYNSKEEILQAMGDLHVSETNLRHILSSVNLPEALICVPISIEGKRIGVMISHQLQRKKVLDEHDLLLLQVFAEQAAIAIQNARYFVEAKHRIVEITQLNSQLQKRQEVQETLTALSLDNKGIEAIIRAFNQMLDAPVIFFNNIENKFYAQNPDVPSDFDPTLLKQIFSTNKKRVYHEVLAGPAKKTACLYPIFNGNVFLGCFIIYTNGKISGSDQIALEQGSSILTLELIKNQTVTGFFYKKSHEQFLALLDAQNDEQLRRCAKEIGLNITAHYFFAIFEIPNYTDLQVLELKVHHLVLKLKEKFPMLESMIYGVQNRVNLLISLPEPKLSPTILQKLESIKHDWDRNGNPSFRAGISESHGGLQSIDKLYDEANKTLAYLASRNRSDIIHYEDIGLNRLFLNQPREEIEQFINEVFSPLSSGNNSKTDLEETLLAYFDENRSATKTAEKLHIHINTLYQRLRKIEQLLQLDLSDSEDTLKVQLACHLRSTYY